MAIPLSTCVATGLGARSYQFHVSSGSEWSGVVLCVEASKPFLGFSAKNRIPFTHAEVVEECMLQSVTVMEGEETVRKYQKIPLSNDTDT
ncbi:hypothetical protein PR048_028543 [Dryococelus australis]|uniref:Uncharacterized protein n=1 Tax=Dryococelus australis TaxID=614101 RepID=A0ABQ9GBJ4_9NEOP|nr:hypothetical protein PR048_028543 [Dryococelus australis]